MFHLEIKVNVVWTYLKLTTILCHISQLNLTKINDKRNEIRKDAIYLLNLELSKILFNVIFTTLHNNIFFFFFFFFFFFALENAQESRKSVIEAFVFQCPIIRGKAASTTSFNP